MADREQTYLEPSPAGSNEELLDQQQALREEIQRLRDEQQRLRDEQEKIRRDGSDEDSGTSDGDAKSQPAKKGEGKAAGEEEKREDKEPVKEKTKGFIARHPAGIIIGAVLLIAAAIGGYLLLQYLDSYESTDDAQIDGHLNAISSRISGTVTGVYVQENQFVQAGQLLLDIDSRDYQVALEQARAAVAQARAQVQAENPNVPITETSNQTTIATSNLDVATAEAGVAAAQQEYQARLASTREAQANNLKAQTDVNRYKQLVDKQEVSRQQYDSVVAAAQTQQATVEAASASAEAAKKVVDQRRAAVAQAQARAAEANRNAPRQVAIRQANLASRNASMQAAQAQVDQAQLNLSYTKIYSPVAGIVSKKSVEVGQRIQPGQDLMAISQTDDIWVTANFKETQLRHMKPGLAADIKVDAFDATFKGYVESMPGATGAKTSLLPPENATGNYVKVVQRLPVRIRFKAGQDPQHRLRPGMSANPKVWLNSN